MISTRTAPAKTTDFGSEVLRKLKNNEDYKYPSDEEYELLPRRSWKSEISNIEAIRKTCQVTF